MSGYRGKRFNSATIINGNSKLGAIPNVSLLPVISCPLGVPCTSTCYCKHSKFYNGPFECWKRNLDACKDNLADFMAGIRAYIRKHQPRLFRWHVAGDIPRGELGDAYYKEMVAIAREFPSTRFLCFTKRHDTNFRGKPDNLTIVLSMWNNFGNTRKKLPRAWYRDPSDPDPRIPDSAMECHGNCEACGLCWELPSIGRDVVFNKH